MAEIIHQTFKMLSSWLGQSYPSGMLVPHPARRRCLGWTLTGCPAIYLIFPGNLVAGAVRLVYGQGRMDQEAMHSSGLCKHPHLLNFSRSLVEKNFPRVLVTEDLSRKVTFSGKQRAEGSTNSSLPFIPLTPCFPLIPIQKHSTAKELFREEDKPLQLICVLILKFFKSYRFDS